MSNESQHTPTPWKVAQDGERIDGPNNESIVLDGEGCWNPFENDADPAFIVRACNSHQALVDALTKMLSVREKGVNGGDLLCRNARAALALAKEA